MLLDRLIASDPGLVRLFGALRILASVGLALIVLTALGFPLPAVLLGGVVGMMSPLNASDPTPGGRAVTLAILPVPAAVSITLAAWLGRMPLVAHAVFVAVIFVAVYLRRFGKRGFGIGMLAFLPYFFALFIGASFAMLPILLLAVLLGIACAAVAVFVLVPHRRRSSLRRMITAFRARTAQVVDGVRDLIVTGELTERRRMSMRRREARLHECALMIEGELADLLPPDDATALSRTVIGLELTVERLAVTARRTAVDDLSPELRLTLRDELRDLLALVRRAPHRLPSGEHAVAREFLGRQDAADGPPAARRLRRAMAEIALGVSRGRALTEALDPTPDPAELTTAELSTAGLRSAGPSTAASAGIGATTADSAAGVEAAAGAERDGLARFAEQRPAEPEAEAPPETGWRRPTTRQALQVSVAAVLAIVVGELISPQRWYWAVITAFVVFAGTTSRGDILVKGLRRTIGTLLGVVCGVFVAFAASGHPPLMLALILLCVFCAFYFFAISYGLMTFFITLALGALYDLLGTFSPQVMVLRLEETVIGAVAGAAAAVLVLPTSTIASLRRDLADALGALREFVDDAVALLADGESVDLIDSARQTDRAVDAVRLTATPLAHRASPFRSRREDVRYALTLLAACAFYARTLATHAEPASLSDDERVPETGKRIAGNLDRLIESVRDPARARPLVTGDALAVDRGAPVPAPQRPADPVALVPDIRRRRLLDAIDRLDDLVLALGRPLDIPDERVAASRRP